VVGVLEGVGVEELEGVGVEEKEEEDAKTRRQPPRAGTGRDGGSAARAAGFIPS